MSDHINGGVVDYGTWSRENVDNKFLRDLKTICESTIPDSSPLALTRCKGGVFNAGGGSGHGAEAYYFMVRHGGHEHFDTNPSTHPNRETSGGPRVNYPNW